MTYTSKPTRVLAPAWRKLFTACGLGLWLTLFSPPASAQLCTVLGVAPLFGTYSTSTGAPANGSVTVTCIVLGIFGQDVSYTVKLGMSTQALGNQRRMKNGTAFLNYNVFCDGGYSQIWGNGVSPTCAPTGGQAGLLGNLVTIYPVYGNIPAGQYVTPGTYGDSIDIEVLY
ncbi:Spore coat protein U (SCPU) domain-containing protein [Polaromonas sp. YR568]|uniref:Csu type fimbrial protein n=1 Tax=Polaromonas sp. YR568 TaxID=1855301 RepID=UPI0008F36B7B|nr:spore coat U domain-containing protein [Polaromonas sp. YR568]SFU38669.1 Spore coat protein U (SCPU) domain-containing protein [Polaromonas sp. YR568]